MKKIVLALGIVTALLACSQKPSGYAINGAISGEVENGTKVFLRKVGENNLPVDVDTTTLENGKFLFTGNAVKSPEMRYIFIDKLPGYAAVILENGDVEINAQKDSLGMAKIKGAPQNDKFASYLEKSQEINLRGISIQEDLQKATLTQNEASVTSLTDEMKELQEEYKNLDLDFIKNNPDALISVLLIDRALVSRSLPAAEVQILYDGLSPDIKESPAAVRLVEQINAAKKREEIEKNTEVGSKAPDFSAPTPAGQQLALKDVMGKVTLIDFWAAWCKPCRAENPNVVNAYKKYHDKGLNILGVSLDRSAEDWKNAIADDGLIWNQVSHVAYFEDPIAKLYGVDAIPAAFLLDENGIIVAKNLRGSQLEEKVAELLQ
ncbi:MAG: AhpC/TSA family protein [Maribacter sp.]|nr:AhpC/TSA family protein [Maribacter sp.]